MSFRIPAGIIIPSCLYNGTEKFSKYLKNTKTQITYESTVNPFLEGYAIYSQSLCMYNIPLKLLIPVKGKSKIVVTFRNLLGKDWL